MRNQSATTESRHPDERPFPGNRRSGFRFGKRWAAAASLATVVAGLMGAVAGSGAAAEAGRGPAGVLAVDWRWTNGVVRAVHGGNNGPLASGETVDLTPFHRELAIPWIRLHDTGWPYPDVVDIHAVFPNPAADPEDPASYRFGPTDDYLRAITNVGARIVYRLGESIEHAARKRYVHPPADPARWARIAIGIIRHYNEGWANGHRLGITHWEIWNEPENRPAMWTGSPDQYYQLYITTARAIRARWPHLKVGGPSLGHQGTYRATTLEPSEFLRGFLTAIRRSDAPFDFFSWHLYTDDPGEMLRRGRAVRDFLDREGWRATESHLNEWNYLPGRDWGPMLSKNGAERERWYARQGGPDGAAFAAAGLIALNRAPVDVGNYYATDNQPFGLFTLHGAPKATYHAFRAYRELLRHPVQVTGGDPGGDAGGVWWLGSIDPGRGEAALLVAWPGAGEGMVQAIELTGWPWPGAIDVTWAGLSPEGQWGPEHRKTWPPAVVQRWDGNWTRPSVALLRLRRVTQ